MVTDVVYGELTRNDETNGNPYSWNAIVISGLNFTPTHGLILPKSIVTYDGGTTYGSGFLAALADGNGFSYSPDGAGDLGIAAYHSNYFTVSTASGSITFMPKSTTSSDYRIMTGTYQYIVWREEN